jgi:hypothetical protein
MIIMIICVTYLLTPWCRILFEKLKVIHLATKYPDFCMEPEGSLPCSQKPATGLHPEPAESSSFHFQLLRSCQRFSPGPKCFEIFRNKINFYGGWLLAPPPIPTLEDHPLSAVRYFLFKIFAVNLLIPWRPSLHPQPEDAPCHGDKGPT